MEPQPVLTFPGQSGPESNGNEGVLPKSPKLELHIRCSLVSYPEHQGFFFWSGDLSSPQ